MILSDKKIKELLKSGELSIEPVEDHQIQPGSVDCTLGDHFLLLNVQKTSQLSLDQKPEYHEITANEITIPPHSFALATTKEYVKLPDNLTAFVEGRSSIGRLGLFIENAGWVDPGFEGRITLELLNVNSVPIKLEAGRRVCQLVFCQLDQAAEKPYRGKYQGQAEAVGSRVFEDEEAN